MCVWVRGMYYMRVINFLKKSPECNHSAGCRGYATRATQWPPPAMRNWWWWWIVGLCSSQLRTRTAQHLVFFSHVLPAHWLSIKGNVGPIEILQLIFYSESMTPVVYSCWQTDNHKICWGAWEQSSWASAWWRLSYDVAFISRDDDQLHTLTVLGIHIANVACDIKTILIMHRNHPQCLVPWPAAATLAHPRRQVTHRVISRLMLIKCLPGPPMHMLTQGWGEECVHWSNHSPVSERILLMKALGTIRQKKQVLIIFVNFYFFNQAEALYGPSQHGVASECLRWLGVEWLITGFFYLMKLVEA